ncbi:hypothetical protein ACN2XU_23820 [Primorskyibacter sp. 2E107]|uniref:hypothetical protein n=1 Tax=Primorskyibacter sp. 2E107 TaxID=3403458 RepID=UPI003AF59A53
MDTPRGQGGLFVSIPWFEGVPVWSAAPKALFGREVGTPYWRGLNLGLFGDVPPDEGVAPLATVEAPEDGLDAAPLNSKGRLVMADGSTGIWTVVGKTRFIETYWKLER